MAASLHPLIAGCRIIFQLTGSADYLDRLWAALLTSSKQGTKPSLTKGEIDMKRFAASMVLASGCMAALLGLAGTAQADLGDVIWSQQQNRVYVPHVDSSVHQSR